MNTEQHEDYLIGLVQCLVRRDLLHDALAKVAPEEFASPRHGAIWQAAASLDVDGRIITAPAVLAKVAGQLPSGRQGRPNVEPAEKLLRRLATFIPDPMQFPEAVRVVKETARTRRLMETLQRAQQRAMAAENYSEAIQSTREEIDSLRPPEGQKVSQGVSGDEITDALDTWGHSDLSALQTGILDLDAVLNVGAGGLVVIGGRPGAGKSILGAQIARHYALTREETVIYHCLEMTRTEMIQRDLAAIARVNLGTATGKMALDDYSRAALTRAADTYSEAGKRLIYDDQSHLSVADVRARIEDTYRSDTPAVSIIDYLGLMTKPRADRNDLAVGENVRQLKQLASEFGIVLVLLAQINRGPEQRHDGRPVLSDLRDSGEIENHADVVILVHDVATYMEPRQGELDLLLAKHRKGPRCTITVADQRSSASMGDLRVQREPRGDGFAD